MCCCFESAFKTACILLKGFLAMLLFLQMIFGIFVTVGAGYLFQEAAPPKPDNKGGNNLESSLSLFNYASEVKDFTQTDLAQACVTLMCAGVVLSGVGVVGFSSLMSGKPKILLLLLALLVVSSTFATYLATELIQFKAKALDSVYDVMSWTLETQYDGNLNSSNRFSRLWDIGHITFGCCGIHNSTDFDKALRFGNTYIGPEVGFLESNGSFQTLYVPASCCRLSDDADKESILENLALGNFNGKVEFSLNDSSCLTFPTSGNSNMNLGCSVFLESIVTRYSKMITGVGATAFSLQVFLQLGIIAMVYASLI